jgi:hypothetical protein
MKGIELIPKELKNQASQFHPTTNHPKKLTSISN